MEIQTSPNKRSIKNIVGIVILSVLSLYSIMGLLSLVQGISADLNNQSPGDHGLFSLVALIPTMLAFTTAMLSVYFLVTLIINAGSTKDFVTWPVDRLKQYYRKSTGLALFGILFTAGSVLYAVINSQSSLAGFLMFAALIPSIVILVVSYSCIAKARKINKSLTSSNPNIVTK